MEEPKKMGIGCFVILAFVLVAMPSMVILQYGIHKGRWMEQEEFRKLSAEELYLKANRKCFEEMNQMLEANRP